MEIILIETDRIALRTLQRTSKDRSNYIKVTVILSLDQGISVDSIACILGIDISTVYRYAQAYQQDGLPQYLKCNYSGYWGLLSSCQLSELRKELTTNLYTNSKQVVAWVKQRWGLSYTAQGMVDLLHRIGFSYKQTSSVPCEADAGRQTAFIAEFEQLVTQSSEEDSVIYFADGVHPTHNTRATRAWIETGTQRVLLTVSGRDRVNINAAYNAQNPVEVIAQEDVTINAQSTQALFEKILDANPSKKVIYIITDNAKYYKNKALKAWVENTKIKMIYLPPYSPNLNPIERLWKFMRQKVINTQFYRTKHEFKDALLKFFDQIHQYKTELEALLTLKFHVINSQSFSD